MNYRFCKIRFFFGVLSGASLALAAGALVGCGPSQAPAGGGPQAKPPEVSVSKVVVDQVADYEVFPGRLEAVNSIEVRARVTGFLAKVDFKEGSSVNKGDLLFEIDPRPYQAELERTEGIILQMEGRLKRLEADYARAQTLLPKNAVSQEEFDKIVGDRTEAEGNVKVARANRDMANLKVGWTKVIAPIRGKISRRFVDPGNLVKEDETVLTTIVDVDPIYAYFDLDERTTLRLQKLIRERKVVWSTEGKLPVYLGLADEEKDTTGEHEGFPRSGTINFADNKVDADTGTWRLRGLFANTDLSLSPGLFVRVRLPVGEPYQAKLVSEQALGTDQGEKFVYVVDDHNIVSKPHVEIGSLHHGRRVITKGLSAEDKVIVSGLQRARPKIPVTPVLVPMPSRNLP